MSSQVVALRALIVVRLSRLTDESTSPERQRAECEALCAQRGYEVVGVAEDLDVSAGSTSPFDRPQLSQWLNEPQRYDVIVFYRVDRLVRRIMHLARMIDWSQTHGVNLVSATESHFDLSNPVGRVLAVMVASFAEMELEAISERNSNAFRHNVRAGKWRGGVPPWGYLPEQQADGTWKLVQDPVQVKVIREVVDRVLSGEPMRAIAHSLTSDGVLTTKDRFAEVQGRPVSGYEWSPSPLKRSLSSPTLLGQLVTREIVLDANGQPVRKNNGKKEFGPETVLRSEDGSPVVRAEPILTKPEFDRLQQELASRGNRKEPTQRSSGLLLRVIYCGACGKPAYKLKGGKGRADRYRCASAQYKDPCGNLTITMAEADEAATKALLMIAGDSERMVRTWEPGEDHAAELADVDELLTDLTGQVGTGPYKRGTPQRAALDARISELAERREVLAAIPSRPSGWTYRGTGEMLSDWWERQTVMERNVFLRSNNVRVWFKRGKENNSYVDLGDLRELTKDMVPGPTVSRTISRLDWMRDHGVAGHVTSTDPAWRPSEPEAGYVWKGLGNGEWFLWREDAWAAALEEYEAEEKAAERRADIASDFPYGDD
ncbi:recombinase family protein [Nocardia brasiliensis]|uniref:Recombinase family protein n=1 Tax=Nocardia brasiliensis TaxID=37326 RepID=A0A6G9XK97_NOCBR|nr:recombinase family protein [Nocardia brasiliensis]QIS01280.1 recombinase family protein [Nocardia brasiliensis]